MLIYLHARKRTHTHKRIEHTHVSKHTHTLTHTHSDTHTPHQHQVKRLDERLRKADADAQLYNAREGLLGLPITDYSHVGNLIDLFDPFLQFWTTSSAWKVRQHNSASLQSCSALASGMRV